MHKTTGYDMQITLIEIWFSAFLLDFRDSHNFHCFLISRL